MQSTSSPPSAVSIRQPAARTKCVGPAGSGRSVERLRPLAPGRGASGQQLGRARGPVVVRFPCVKERRLRAIVQGWRGRQARISRRSAAARDATGRDGRHAGTRTRPRRAAQHELAAPPLAPGVRLVHQHVERDRGRTARARRPAAAAARRARESRTRRSSAPRSRPRRPSVPQPVQRAHPCRRPAVLRHDHPRAAVAERAHVQLHAVAVDVGMLVVVRIRRVRPARTPARRVFTSISTSRSSAPAPTRHARGRPSRLVPRLLRTPVVRLDPARTPPVPIAAGRLQRPGLTAFGAFGAPHHRRPLASPRLVARRPPRQARCRSARRPPSTPSASAARLW